MTMIPLRFLADAVRSHADTRPNKPALVFGERVTRYSELNSRANRIANALVAAGLPPQTRIAILAANCDRFFEIWQGASRANMVLTPINFRLAPAQIRYVLDDAKARLLFVGEEFADVVLNIEGRDWLRGDGSSPKVHSDGIALSPDRAYLYYQALTGRTMYRVPTEALTDPELATADLAGRVETVGRTGAADGLIFGRDGMLYISALKENAIRRLDPMTGRTEIVAADA